MLELDNPMSICNKRRVYLLYITNLDDIMGYSQVYTVIINDDCSRLSHVWPTAQFPAIFEGNEWPRRIESRICIYLFNDLAQYFFCILLLYLFFIACYMNIFKFYSIFFTQLLIHVIYYLPPLLIFLCCLVSSNPGDLFCDADTLPLGYWSLWSSAFILYIKLKYVLTCFRVIYSNIFYWAGRTYVQYSVRKLPNVN